MARGVRLVIFDVDGTLVDSQAHITGAMTLAFEALGEAVPPRDRVLSVVGLSLPQAMAALAPELGPESRARLAEAYREAYFGLRSNATAPLYPGARETLLALAGEAELLLGVATGKSRRGVEHMIEAHGLEEVFVTRQTADDHPSKPHPSMIETALAETGVAPDAAVMIGDTTFDMDMARAAGVAGIGVAWGYHPVERLVAAGAARVLTGFDELAPALAQLWRQPA